MLSRRHTLSLAALAALALPGPVFGDDGEARAARVVATLLADTHGAMAGGDGDAGLKRAVDAAFAFDIWEEFLLQPHADAVPAEARAEVRALLPGFLAHLYRERFATGMTEAPAVGETRKVRRDVLVSSSFPRPDRRPLPVDWRLRDFGGQMRVIDVMVAGTSFLLLKRDEFASLIEQGGADALLAHMRQNAI